MKIQRLLLALLVLNVAVLPALAAGDTGTYRILDYRVTLTPHSDGKVGIDFYQKWLVTGGHVPWTTLGLPNEMFEIKSLGRRRQEYLPSERGWMERRPRRPG